MRCSRFPTHSLLSVTIIIIAEWVEPMLVACTPSPHPIRPILVCELHRMHNTALCTAYKATLGFIRCGKSDWDSNERRDETMGRERNGIFIIQQIVFLVFVPHRTWIGSMVIVPNRSALHNNRRDAIDVCQSLMTMTTGNGQRQCRNHKTLFLCIMHSTNPARSSTRITTLLHSLYFLDVSCLFAARSLCWFLSFSFPAYSLEIELKHFYLVCSVAFGSLVFIE